MSMSPQVTRKTKFQLLKRRIIMRAYINRILSSNHKPSLPLSRVFSLELPFRFARAFKRFCSSPRTRKVSSLLRMDGIESPKPALSGLLTDLAMWFTIEVGSCSRKTCR